MPHYRRRPDRPVLVESVTIRRLQGQTSRLSFVTLSIEPTITSLYDNRVVQQLKSIIKTFPTDGEHWNFLPAKRFQGVHDALMTVCTPHGRVPRWGRVFFFFFSGWMWECVITQYVQCNEREAERPRHFFTRLSSGTNEKPWLKLRVKLLYTFFFF